MDEDLARSEDEWAADRRDFVADRRDETADSREEAADRRDDVVDSRERRENERERDLTDRERRLEADARELGLAVRRLAESAAAVSQRREDDANARAAATERRRDERTVRDAANAQRRDIAERRQADTPQTGLALAFAEIALHLYQSQDVDAVLNTIVRAAVATLIGCDMASITAREMTTFRTVVSTHPTATDVDDLQYAADEGPCLEAIEEVLVYAPEFPDVRWPRLASGPTRVGVHSVASFRVASSNRERANEFAGSLNAYSRNDHAFERQAREIGVILAAHASTAVSAVRDRVWLEQQATQLHEALQTRDIIGQATGILMERLRVTPGEAFDILRRASQNLNLKLRLVAESFTETGELRTKDK